MPVADLVAGKVPGNSEERFSLYARGWLLGHYLTFAPERSGQLGRYLDEFAKGRPAIDAAHTAFGDLGTLQKDLDRYLAREKFPYLTLGVNRLAIGPVEVTPIGPGGAAVMPLYQRLQTRVSKFDDAGEAATARTLAAAHPHDPLVMMALAEAEWVAGDFVAAEAAADRAIALMPKSAEALIWKGRAIQSRAAMKMPGAIFSDARAIFGRANRLDPENPEALLYFYRSFRTERVRPTANAIAALHYAAELAPQDLDLSLESALQHVRDGEGAKARPALVRAAQHPHGGELSAKATALIAIIDAGKIVPTTMSKPAAGAN
jgi:tetratricopeptide (TPR) repeat protein